MDKQELLEDLISKYKQKHKKSEILFNAAKKYQIGGGSHNLRLFEPFPFYDAHSSGSRVTDVDGNTYVDFWQGHFGNVLGHNPPPILEALNKYFHDSQGLATGFPGIAQKKLAELILGRIGAEKIRFTTSGTLATMYAIMLSRAYTGRRGILKIGGGWHGAQPYALKGISVFQNGLGQTESAGLPVEMDAELIISEFNNLEDLEEKFKLYGEQIACLIMEPFIGAGGFIFGYREYIKRARELSQEYGVLLIFDEVVSGFRFHAGALHSLYKVTPDLLVLGKAIGGGMPVSAVAGKESVMELCESRVPVHKRVKFEGGTFSAHPSCMLAGYTFLKYLIENEDDIYLKIGRMGAWVRESIEEIFSANGFNVRCTGGNEDITENSSIIGVHFLKENIARLTSPEQVWNPEINDFEVKEKIFKLAMLLEGFNIFHGYGAISYAHTEEEIQQSLDAIENIARKWRGCGFDLR